MDNKDIAREWFKVAESDLNSAVFLKKMVPNPLKLFVIIVNSRPKNI